MKTYVKIIIVAVVVLLFLLIAQLSGREQLNWTKTYRHNEKAPFGTYVNYELLDTKYNSKELTLTNKSIVSQLLTYESSHNVSFFFIQNDLDFNNADSKALLKLAENGSKVFICANTILGLIADTFKIKNKAFDYDIYNFSQDSLIKTKTTKIKFLNPSLSQEASTYSYDGHFEGSGFKAYDSTSLKVVSTINDDRPNILSVNYGEGSIIFCSTPDMFANYYLVNNRNKNACYKALSMIANREIVYSDNYKFYGNGDDDENNPEDETPFKFILKHDALYYAWVLLLFSTLLFMVFSIKRKQRKIPIIEPPTNTSIEFVEIVGNVYFKSGNHKTIAEEKIIIFLEFIRSKFQISTHLFDEAFYERISNISSIDKNWIITFFNFIQQIQNQKEITQNDLIQLNTLIEEFHTKNKR